MVYKMKEICIKQTDKHLVVKSSSISLNLGNFIYLPREVHMQNMQFLQESATVYVLKQHPQIHLTKSSLQMNCTWPKILKQ